MAFPSKKPVLPAAGIPPKFRAILQLIIDWIYERQVLPGPGVGYNETPGGVLIFGSSSGGGAFELKGFQLVLQGENKIRVVRSLLLGEAPTGFSSGDKPEYVLTASGSSGVIYGVVTLNDTSGAVTSRTLGIGSSLPSPTDTTFIFPIGSYDKDGDAITVQNDRFGPILGQVVRDWSKGPGDSGRWVIIDQI